MTTVCQILPENSACSSVHGDCSKEQQIVCVLLCVFSIFCSLWLLLLHGKWLTLANHYLLSCKSDTSSSSMTSVQPLKEMDHQYP